MRVTLFGSSGLLGQDLVKELSGEQLTALSSKDADVRDTARVQEVIGGARPDWTILAAAYTDVDGCESNRDLAFAVNCQGAINVAQAARQAGSRLIFVSTDYVFDGAKSTPYEADDARNPINIYGESKARAEERLIDLFPDVTPDLASALAELCRKGASGIVHVTNSRDCTWYEFAKAIVATAGLPTIVRPVTSAEFPRPARRPACSILSPASLHCYGIRMPEWQDGLRRYLRGVPSISA